MLSTLMEASRPGQRRPAAAEAAGLLVHGMAVRLDLSAEGAVGEIMGSAASPALMSAAVLALAALVFGELASPGPVNVVPAAHFGPFLTIGPFASRAEAAGTLIVCTLPWLVLSFGHAPQPAIEAISAAPIAVAAGTLASVGIGRQVVLTRREPRNEP